MLTGMDKKPILYIKPGCPWCREARAHLANQGIDFEVRDVTASSQNMDRMVSVSGQTLTPTFEYGEFVVSDFDVTEFQDALDQNPEIKQDLGLGASEEI